MSENKADVRCPISAFITNLGKYNEGDLIGQWVSFPTSAEEMQRVLSAIGIGKPDACGVPYEEWFIIAYENTVRGLSSALGEFVNLDELNYLAVKLNGMEQSELEQFEAALTMDDHCGSLQELINLTDNLDCYDFLPDISDEEALGRYYLLEVGSIKVPDELVDYIDYEALGRDAVINENGEFQNGSYVRRSGSKFYEFYNGQPETIPAEYKIMSTEKKLPAHIEAMQNAATQAERSYAAEAAAFVRTPESILEQVQLEKERVRDRFRALAKPQSKSTPKKYRPKER